MDVLTLTSALFLGSGLSVFVTGPLIWRLQFQGEQAALTAARRLVVIQEQGRQLYDLTKELEDERAASWFSVASRQPSRSSFLSMEA